MAALASDFRIELRSGSRGGLWRRVKAWRRLLRRRHAKRRLLQRVLAETSDARVLEEVGLAPPDPSGLELFARALLRHRR